MAPGTSGKSGHGHLEVSENAARGSQRSQQRLSSLTGAIQRSNNLTIQPINHLTIRQNKSKSQT